MALLPFLLLLLLLSISGLRSEAAMFTIINNCPYTIWPATLAGGGKSALSTTGLELGPYGRVSVYAPYGWQGRVWARNGCKYNGGRLTCATGDCGSGQAACNGAGGRPPATLAEFQLNGYAGKDFYDVSLVDGFNLPMSITPNKGCWRTSCPVDINGRCPGELQVRAPDGSVAGCRSACEAFNTDRYCCRGAFNRPETCPPTYYSQIFKNHCPQAYSYAYDDATSTFTCAGSPDYEITFCPPPSTSLID